MNSFFGFKQLGGPRGLWPSSFSTSSPLLFFPATPTFFTKFNSSEVEHEHFEPFTKKEIKEYKDHLRGHPAAVLPPHTRKYGKPILRHPGFRRQKGGKGDTYKITLAHQSARTYFEKPHFCPLGPERKEMSKLMIGKTRKAPLHIPYRDPNPVPRFGITKDIFLEKIGKNCAQYAEKFESWEEFIKSKKQDLKKKEIPIVQRRWILKWIEDYKQGIEPNRIRFQSKSNCNKEIRAEAQEAHKAKFNIHLERKKKLIEAEKERRLALRKLVLKLDTENGKRSQEEIKKKDLLIKEMMRF